MRRMTEQPEKKYKEEDEFFEEENEDEQPTQQQPESEPLWLIKRREWLRSLSKEDRDYISRYGFELWEKRKNSGLK